MTDSQLEDYTRLKIGEALKDIREKYEAELKEAELKEARKNVKPYCRVKEMWLGYSTFTYEYYDSDELTTELKDLNDKYIEIKNENCNYEYKITRFENESLLTRLVKAFKGKI
jgi:hypothetical protein